MPEVLCLSNRRTRKSIFRNRPRDHWAGCTQVFAIQCMDTVQLYFLNVWGPCFHTAYPAKLCIRGELGPALLTEPVHSIEGYMPQLRIFPMEMAQLYVLCFCHVGKLLTISRWSKKAVNIPLGKEGAESVPCFHSLEGKTINPPSTLYSDCLIQCCLIQCCDQSAKVYRVSCKQLLCLWILNKPQITYRFYMWYFIWKQK